MNPHAPILLTTWRLPLPILGKLIAVCGLVSLALLSPRVVSAQGAPKANSLIVWEAPQTMQDIAGKILAVGGRVDHVFPPNAAIVHVPLQKINDLQAQIAGLKIAQEAVDLGEIDQLTGAGSIAASNAA